MNNVSQTGNYYQLYSNNLSGGDERRLTFSAIDEWSAEWSPDGRAIVYLTERDGSNTNSAIYLMDADGGNQRPLYDSPYYEWAPSWSADGTLILNAEARDNDRDDLYIMSTSGADVHLLTAQGSYPSWAPPRALIHERDCTMAAPGVFWLIISVT